ncbi:MAG: right-handed parallel beta-helix repeat-containing protein [Balneolaceae bacterium]|nr:right-handed parallel beta-helix repeat-containing protein [Balneolaceae bacterium]
MIHSIIDDRRITKTCALLVLFAMVLFTGCSELGFQPGPPNGRGAGNGGGNGNGPGITGGVEAQDLQTCQETGHEGLTAKYVNTTLNGGSMTVAPCDIGTYYDEDGHSVRGVSITGTTDGAKSEQFGVYSNGASLDVSHTDVTVEDDYPHQFISIGYLYGASGSIADNTIEGAHRVGILLDREGTDARVTGNSVTGTGAQTTGWAENGIQISRGATGKISGNTVSDHWWDLNNFGSSGIIVNGSDDVHIRDNELSNNDYSIALAGNGNKVLHNRVVNDARSTVNLGVYVSGSNNKLVQNSLGADGGTWGIYVFANSGNTKLIGNSLDGWDQPIVDNGSDTKLPPPFDPENP